MQRRIGLQEPGWGYIGTIVSALHLAVTTDWHNVPSELEIAGTDAADQTHESLDAFRREVESSQLFAAFSAGEITHLVVSVGH